MSSPDRDGDRDHLAPDITVDVVVIGAGPAGVVDVGRLWHAVPALPAVSEVWLRLHEEYGL